MGYFAQKYGNQSVAPNQSLAPIQSMLPKKPLPVIPKKQSILQSILTAIANAPKKNIKKTGEAVKKNIEQAGKAVMGVSKVGQRGLEEGNKIIKSFFPIIPAAQEAIKTKSIQPIIKGFKENLPVDTAKKYPRLAGETSQEHLKRTMNTPEEIKNRKFIENSIIASIGGKGGEVKPKGILGLSTKEIKASPLQEARKYKSADEFVKAQGTKSPAYAVGEGTGHTAPIRDADFAPLHKLDEIYPKDIYSDKASRLYSSGYKEADTKVFEIVNKIRNNSNAEVTIYRAVPSGKGIKDFNKGDWVTLTEDYAKQHGESNLNGKYEILSKKVKADEIFSDANSIQEFGYDPRSLSKSQLIDTWKEANKSILPNGGMKPPSVPPKVPPSGSKPSNIKPINLDKFNVSENAKNAIDNEFESLRPKLEGTIGKPLKLDEVKKYAQASSRVLERSVGREETLKFTASMQNLGERIAQASESGTMTKEFLDDMVAFKSNSTDIARSLGSMRLIKDPTTTGAKNAIIDKILETNKNLDDILAKAKGVDFNDANQATAFYRQFVKPKAGEIIDLIRYNSMLSSPLTHIVNTASNILNSTVLRPTTKLVTGGLDYMRATATKTPRQAFSGEAGAYLSGYFKNIGNATKRFTDTISGKRAMTNLDLRNIPMATKGVAKKAETILSTPMRFLEAADQFFTALTEGGATKALQYRQAKGIPVKHLAAQAQEEAAYTLFRQKPGVEGQGAVLDAVDKLTNLISNARNSKNAIVSIISKFTFPFIQTPMNIFKQGIETSPLGFSTIIGAKNKTEQIAKALIGTGIFMGSSMLLTSGRLTFSEPTSQKERNMWKAAGVQPYSVKVGNKWISYQKLPTPIAFSLALSASLNDLLQNRKTDDNIGSLILRGVAKYGRFLTDQTYFKSMGDLVAAVTSGRAYDIEKVAGNYPQQLIPFRAFGGWLARLTDEAQRQPDAEGFIDKQIQLLMMNIPGLSQKVPPRLGPDKQPITNQNKIINAISPFRVSTENQELKEFLNSSFEIKKLAEEKSSFTAKEKERIMPIYQQAQLLKEQGKTEEAKILVDQLSDEDYAIYKKIKSSESAKKTEEMKTKIFPIYKQAQELKSSGRADEAKVLVDGLSDEEYEAYKKLKKQFEY